MLGPIGASLMSILRVLTPAEIELYTQKAHEEKKVTMAVAVGAEGSSGDYIDQNKPEYETKSDPNETQAQVIPLHPDLEITKPPDETIEKPPDKEQAFLEEYSFDDDEEDDQESQEKNNSELEELGIYSAQKIKKQKAKDLEKKKSKRPSASVFLITERKKLKASQQKLKEQQALENYQKNSVKGIIHKEVNFDEDEDELTLSTGFSGVLINKKQG